MAQLVPDLLTALDGAAPVEEGFGRLLRELVKVSGARSGGLVFRPDRGEALTLVTGARPGSRLDRLVRERLVESPRGTRLDPVPGRAGPARRRPLVAFSAALGDPSRPVGRLVLVAGRGSA